MKCREPDTVVHSITVAFVLAVDLKLLDFPESFRKLAAGISHWIEACSEDRQKLEKKLGMIRQAQQGISDVMTTATVGRVNNLDAASRQQFSNLHREHAGSSVYRVGSSPDPPVGPDRIVSASDKEKSIIVWAVASRQQISTLKGHKHYVTSVAWSPRGDQVASASNDKSIIVWSATSGEQVLRLEGHTGWIKSVAWSPKGDQIASGSSDNTIIVWDATTGEQVTQLKGHSAAVTSVAWSLGDQLASASADQTAVVWNVASGEQVAQLTGHTGEVNSVSWGQGDQLATASDDRSAVVWNVASGEKP